MKKALLTAVLVSLDDVFQCPRMSISSVTALVTGSSRGIGAAIRAGLVARGVAVIGHASKAHDAETIGADLTDPTAAARIWEAALP